MPYRNITPCPYCNDKGFLRQPLLKADRARGAIGEAIQPCCCTNAVLINKSFPLLSTVADPPSDDFLEISKKVTTIVEKQRVITNSIFYGSEKKFLYFVKSIMMFYWNYTKSFEVLDGLQMLQSYYTSNSEHTLYDLMKYELVAIMFTTSLNNKALDKMVFDTIKNRYRYNKATWIYAPNDSELKTTTEYSESLDQVLELFSVFNLNEPKMFNFKGFSSHSGDVLKSQREKVRKNVQHDLGNI